LLRPIKTTATSMSSSSTIKKDNGNHHLHQQPHDIHSLAEQQRQEWTDKSIAYYSTIMRAERRRNMGQINEAEWDSAHYQETLLGLAQKHYFALRKIKSGHYRHAELIYRRIIQDLLAHKEDEHDGGSGEDCDHASLAVTTLLLALHLQRMGDLKQTRSVFLHFFRVVVLQSKNNNHNHNSSAKEECACSAKVLGAYALFEMKRGNRLKSLEIAKKAIEFDPSMEPVLQWKQFREVVVQRQQRIVSGDAISSASSS
jgi:tetratricopeptide (TPR) repeat protein